MGKMKSKHSLIKYLTMTTGVFSAVFITTGYILYDLTLSRKGLNSKFVSKIINSNAQKHPLDDFRTELENNINCAAIWYDNIEKQPVEILNRDGKALHAQLIKPEKDSNVYVICIHGYNSCPRKMGIYAKQFKQHGYNVLLPSLRGHAESEEEFVTMGWKDRLDVIDWINELVSTHNDCKIILHGVSMGAATTMMVTGEELPDNVKLAVSDCGYTSVWDILGYKLKLSAGLPAFPFLYSADSINKRKEKFSFKEASCVEQIKKSTTPTLFIHGDADDFVPYYMLDEVYNAAGCEKEKLTIHNAPHARAVCVDPELYWKSVFRFIEKYL